MHDGGLTSTRQPPGLHEPHAGNGAGDLGPLWALSLHVLYVPDKPAARRCAAAVRWYSNVQYIHTCTGEILLCAI